MHLHPTLVVPVSPVVLSFLQDLRSAWAARGGPLLDALEVEPDPRQLTRGLTRLLSQERVLQLRRQGHHIDSAVTIVILADAHQPHSVALLDHLRALHTSGEWAGLEVRVHLVLLLPDVTQPPPEAWAQAAEHLKLLAPDPGHQPVTRVWPVSMRNRVDLFLHEPRHLLPYVQHFVELCVHGTDLIQLQEPEGLDWAALGAVRLQLGTPRTTAFQTLLSALPHHSDGPAPTLPAAPHLYTLGHDDTAHRAQDRQLEQLLDPLNDPLPYALGEQALQTGLPHLVTAEAALRTAETEWTARLLEAAAPFDDLYGQGGKRSRLRRLQGHGPGHPDQLRLEQALAEVDSALAALTAEEFAQREAGSESVERRTALQQTITVTREQLRTLPDPPPRRGCLTGWFTWKRKRSDVEDTPPPPDRVTLTRTLSLAEAELAALNQTDQQRRTLWAARHRAWRHAHTLTGAFTREHAAATALLRRVHDNLPDVHTTRPDEPLVMTAARPVTFHDTAIRDVLSSAYRRGLAGALLAGSRADVQTAFEEGVSDLLATLDTLPPPDLNEDYWAAALLASSPRIVSHSHPDQTLAFHLVGELDDLPLASHYTRDQAWYPHETLLLQRLSPLTPDGLLGLDPPFIPDLLTGTVGDDPPAATVAADQALVPSPAAQDTDQPSPPPSPTPTPSSTERPNPALDALFEAL